MSDEFYKALAIIIPSFFGLVTTIVLIIFNSRIGVLHKTINSKMDTLLTVSNAAAKAKGKLEEKGEQAERDKNEKN